MSAQTPQHVITNDGVKLAYQVSGSSGPVSANTIFQVTAGVGFLLPHWQMRCFSSANCVAPGGHPYSRVVWQ
jgi:hypothetical protein